MTKRRDDIDVEPDAPASEEEAAAAEALRLALEDPERPSDDAELARALSLAHAPREIPQSVHSAIISESLEKMATKRAGGRVIRVAFSASAAFAIAAALFLFAKFGASPDAPPLAAAPVPLVQVRSTAPLFREPFDARTASARIDRIALARSDDFRENRYASWGVK